MQPRHFTHCTSSRAAFSARVLLVMLTALCAVGGMAQDAKEQTQQKNVLELPEFVITGAGSLGIQSVRKQDVKDLWGMDSATRALLRPVVGTVRGSATPDSVAFARALTMFPLVAHAQFGLYRTPEGWLRYAGASAPFDWNIHADGAATQGSADNAAASSAAVGAGAGWRMPDNIVAFGNARVGVSLDVATRSYNLFGSPIPTQQRTVNNRQLEIGLNQDGGTMPFSFSMVTGSDEAKDSLQAIDNMFGINAAGALIAPHWTVRGLIYVRGYSGLLAHRSFSHLDFDAQYTVAPFRYAIGMGLFAARNDLFDSRMELAPHASASLLLGGMEIFGSAARGMRDETITTYTRSNPFIDIAALDSIQYPVDEIDARIGVRTADTRMLAAEAHLAYVRTSYAPVFAPAAGGRWTVVYDRTSMIAVAAEARWRAALRTSVIAAGTVRSTTFAGGTAPVPFVPAADASLTVAQTFESPLDVSTTLRIEGRRTGAPDGSAAIPAFVMWDADASYGLTTNISATAQVRNLLDTRYEIWKGYPGTRISAAIGVTARF